MCQWRVKCGRVRRTKKTLRANYYLEIVKRIRETFKWICISVLIAGKVGFIHSINVGDNLFVQDDRLDELSSE